MIKSLHIKNFAIIDEIDINFENGLTIITGETGAGKSILMGALSLVLGERADSNMINIKSDKCIIEAKFNISTNDFAKKYLEENEFESDDELIIRREINSNGKSRIFISDTPTTLSILAPLSSLLLDLHRQFDTIELQNSTHQLDLLDEISSSNKALKQFVEAFNIWKKSEKTYESLLQQNKSIKKELDYNSFIFQEIDSLKLHENEIEQIESELLILENAEAFKQSMQTAIDLLNNCETPIIPNVKLVMQQLQLHSHINKGVHLLVERLTSNLVELKDIHAEIENEYEKVFYDENKIALLNERLNDANRLLKKHHLISTNELLQLRSIIEQKILQAETADEEEHKLSIETMELFNKAKSAADHLSKIRTKHLPRIESEMNVLLKKVGMQNASFKIAHAKSEISKTGIDKIEFLFDANKTNHFKPISKVASGGELSRLMLCIKSMVAESTSLPTLVFDEIDTGISGETAIQVGNIMKQLSLQHQVISITHLPQIASKANQHLYIYKKENASGSIKTCIKSLQDDERIDILAEMLGGKDSSIQAKEMIRELMK